MNPGVVLLSRNPNLVAEVSRQLEGSHPVVSVDSLEAFRQQLESGTTVAALVHLDSLTLDHS
jgi:hypothetical protein